MLSSGTLAATVPPECMGDIEQTLLEVGIPFAFVGRVVSGNGVYLAQAGNVVHHTEIHCEEDELARLWALYPRS
jgi:hypothetical protein